MTAKELTKEILTFEDAQQATGIYYVPDFSSLPENLRKYFEAHYKLVIITQALNQGEKMDYSNPQQEKWFPFFTKSSNGINFDCIGCGHSYAYAGIGSPICFKTAELAKHAGLQFKNLYVNDTI